MGESFILDFTPTHFDPETATDQNYRHDCDIVCGLVIQRKVTFLREMKANIGLDTTFTGLTKPGNCKLDQ